MIQAQLNLRVLALEGSFNRAVTHMQ